ncbi:MAG: potassium transporter TrkH [Deltaproteobacteria bacterium]|nr:potassium transporter TrkH [Deltaproteobacteria bacterium]
MASIEMEGDSSRHGAKDLLTISLSSTGPVGFQGALLAALPVPFMFAYVNAVQWFPALWRLSAASAAAASCVLCAVMLFRHPLMGRLFGGCAALFSCLAALPYLIVDPFAALVGLVCLISIAFLLLDFSPHAVVGTRTKTGENLQRAQWAAVTVLVTICLSWVTSNSTPSFVIRFTITGSTLAAQLLFIHWAWQRKRGPLRVLSMSMGFLFTGLLVVTFFVGYTRALAMVFVLSSFVLFYRSRAMRPAREHGWDALFNHPARLLLCTFLFLCFVGTLLLLFPSVSSEGGIVLVDAAFTAVSAVCVTGLIVLDTPHAFTFLGQALILLLIQLGGLGIMSIAAVAIHVMGRRLSLRQERLLTAMTDIDHKHLLDVLVRILKFTFVAEGIGALILLGLFYGSGDAILPAIWRGLFTAVSAFCNAGFALQSNSLIPYRSNPLILHSVAALIILGGMAPATSLIAPKWLMGRKIPVAPRIALTTTAVLLVSGMLFFLAFEWNGVLSGLSIMDKLHNAWFQSATLRTAGFNSVDVAGIISPTFMVMICFMFIGGSPGGTAGGVKTTTMGILVMTFWANINNRKSIIFQNRRLPSATIHRAITIVICVAVVWFAVVLMLDVTQEISGRDIVFEVTSAIGTVGLSTGATLKLDEIGKVIIMIAMFAGRIGPMTLFMLLSEDVSVPESSCPDVKINLT